ncbi:MAG TPA: hypothetical protein DCE44_19990 [Verrucomicrobiales bacterium]|nr:hypothetical protein [Verrucomicrobiales bacterium]
MKQVRCTQASARLVVATTANDKVAVPKTAGAGDGNCCLDDSHDRLRQSGAARTAPMTELRSSRYEDDGLKHF